MADMNNSLQVNVLDSEYEAYLNTFTDNNITLETEAEGLYLNEDMSYTFANCKNLQLNLDELYFG